MGSHGTYLEAGEDYSETHGTDVKKQVYFQRKYLSIQIVIMRVLWTTSILPDDRCFLKLNDRNSDDYVCFSKNK